MDESVETVGIIGYGEVGEALATHFHDDGYRVIVVNRTPHDLRSRLSDDPIEVADSLADLAQDSDLIISCVWPKTAASVAEACAPHLSEDSLYVDVNSIAPVTVSAIAEMVTAAGAVFVNVSLMDSVRRFGTDIGMALAGPGHLEVARLFQASGLQVQDLGDDPIRPAVLKLSRSTVTKGLIALFTEALLPALEYDLTEEVLDSVDDSFDRQTVGEFARYFLVDTTDHAERRAGEFEEVVSMMEYVNVEAPIAAQALRLHRDIADHDITGEDYRTILRNLRPHYRRDDSAPD